jgi:hypothetical protein
VRILIRSDAACVLPPLIDARFHRAFCARPTTAT